MWGWGKCVWKVILTLKIFIAETFRISPRGKRTVYREGGGGRKFARCWKSSNIIPITQDNRLLEVSGGLTRFLIGTRNGPAACMIIENYPPLPTRSRQNSHHDSSQRFLNHLVLPKHRTSKFSRCVQKKKSFSSLDDEKNLPWKMICPFSFRWEKFLKVGWLN